MPHHLWRENLYQMVLHRPIETTRVIGQVLLLGFHMSV
jgi:hypothetical protein